MNRRRTSRDGSERAGRASSRKGREKRSRGGRARLRASTTAEEAGLPDGEIGAVVPTRWVKALVGLFLLVPAWILTKTFFGALAWAGVEHGFWASEPFWFFGVGVVMWLVVFFGLPRPWWIYVFGHELTHALAVWISGGRVEGWKVSARGGHILADRVNTWIALAPYFVPIYSVLLLGIFGVAGLFWDLGSYMRLLYGGLGFTWAFHFTFTCSMIPKGQSDLAYGGGFFSLVVIYLANLILLSVLLVVAAEPVSPLLFLLELVQNASDFVTAATGWLRSLRG